MNLEILVPRAKEDEYPPATPSRCPPAAPSFGVLYSDTRYVVVNKVCVYDIGHWNFMSVQETGC